MIKKIFIISFLPLIYIGLTFYYIFLSRAEDAQMNLLWVDGINEFFSLLIHDITGVELERFFGKWFEYFRVMLGILEWFLIGVGLYWVLCKFSKIPESKMVDEIQH